MSVSQAEIDRFKDRQAIYDCLLRNARGVDRTDASLIKTAYHEHATTDHGIFSGNAWEFAEFIGPFNASIGVRQQTHRVDHALIEFSGLDSAAVESYNLTFLDTETPNGMMAATVGGRYLDRFERHGGAWKIAHRLYVMDWNRNEPSTVDWNGSFFLDLVRGRIDSQDESYKYLPKII
ncbi:MAG: nuclear transport factor 2 family protein [Pseudomonadales bacterium]